MAYTLNMPAANQKLSVSQPLIQDNFNTANTVMGIDHYPFDNLTSSKGYHKQVHLVAGSDVANVSGTTILYSKVVTTDSTVPSVDTQLFSRTAAGAISQMTGGSASNEGYAWAGGFLFQWGRVSFASSTANGTVTFKDRVPGAIPFPNNCFNVQVSFNRTGTTLGSPSNSITTLGLPTRFSFDWRVNILSGIDGFFWLAVGN